MVSVDAGNWGSHEDPGPGGAHVLSGTQGGGCGCRGHSPTVSLVQLLGGYVQTGPADRRRLGAWGWLPHMWTIDNLAIHALPFVNLTLPYPTQHFHYFNPSLLT